MYLSLFFFKCLLCLWSKSPIYLSALVAVTNKAIVREWIKQFGLIAIIPNSVRTEFLAVLKFYQKAFIFNTILKCLYFIFFPFLLYYLCPQHNWNNDLMMMMMIMQFMLWFSPSYLNYNLNVWKPPNIFGRQEIA